MKDATITLPDEVAVMPLPGAVLFPHALLPLYIFEPRYREMLEHALQRDRMFSVTLIKPSCPEWRAQEDFFHFATVGLIRACVGRGDGTSNLVLQGLHRVRFTGFEQETPFPVDKIDIVESDSNATRRSIANFTIGQWSSIRSSSVPEPTTGNTATQGQAPANGSHDG